MLTSPGERVMIPEFGAGLRNYLFSNEYDTLEAEITSRIEDQVGRYMSFVEINNIEFTRHEPQYLNSQKSNRIDVLIHYSVPTFNFSDMLKVSKIDFI